MKILFVVDYYQPKLGYGSFYIPRELAKMGHSVTILTSDHYYPFPNYKETVENILGPRKVKSGLTIENGVNVIRKKLLTEVFTRAIFFGHFLTLRSLKPQIVIVDKTAGYSAILISLLKPIFKYKIVSVDAHLPSGFEAEGNVLFKNIFYFLFRVVFSHLINTTVDKFVAVQEDTEKIMRKYYGVRKNLVHIPLGTDLDVFKYDRKSRTQIREKYSISPRDFVIIYTGKVIKEKGVHILTKAFGVLRKKYANLKLLVVGAGPLKYIKMCLKQVPQIYQKDIKFTGFYPTLELYKLYSASDLGVWPLQESMAMNDACACNLPFIANDTVGAKLRLSNNNALLYKQGSSNDLAEKISFMVDNQVERLKMGKRARKLAETKLSWEKISKSYIDF